MIVLDGTPVIKPANPCACGPPPDQRRQVREQAARLCSRTAPDNRLARMQYRSCTRATVARACAVGSCLRRSSLRCGRAWLSVLRRPANRGAVGERSYPALRVRRACAVFSLGHGLASACGPCRRSGHRWLRCAEQGAAVCGGRLALAWASGYCLRANPSIEPTAFGALRAPTAAAHLQR